MKIKIKEDLSRSRSKLRDIIDEILEFLIDTTDVPYNSLSEWEDLRSDLQSGDDVWEISCILQDYLEPQVTFNRKHPSIYEDDPLAEDIEDYYKKLIWRMNEYLADNGDPDRITESNDKREYSTPKRTTIPTDRFKAIKRTALDGKTWWVIYDTKLNKYTTILALGGKYKTKRDAENAIGYYCLKGECK